VGTLRCVGAVLLPRKLEQYGHDLKRQSIPIPEGQAALPGMGLATNGHVTHGTEVTPVQQDDVECTQHHPRDQIAREGEHAVGGAWSVIRCHRFVRNRG
jgi:hypothetical protein